MIVAMTVGHRTHYLEKTLSAWARAENPERVPFMFQVEPNCHDSLNLINEFCPTPAYISVNHVRAGVAQNPWQAATNATLLDQDFIVMAEDDGLVSRDVLGFFRFCADRWRHDPDVLAVCAYQQRPNIHDDPKSVVLQDWFGAVCWGFWPTRWPELSETWDHDESKGGWDANILYNVMGDRRCAHPLRARVQHLGVDGAHCHVGRYEDTVAKSFVDVTGTRFEFAGVTS